MSWDTFFKFLADSGQRVWSEQLKSASTQWLVHHGDYPRWCKALEQLPEISDSTAHFDRSAVTINGQCLQPELLLQALQGLMPWRKGPYQFCDIKIDTEWRSDFKWDRVLPHLKPLEGRRILDIGCGNGYHCWRMMDESPELVVGIEPSVLFNLQFQAVRRYVNLENITLLPIGVEHLPEKLAYFDTVFSMGVLYHRKSPVDHIYQLRDCLKIGGELCLETLVVEGEEGKVLLPSERYARMRNVWFIPSSAELVRWLERCGFANVRVVDENYTSLQEQRSTEWMQFESLSQCLNPDDPFRTVEDLPAPRRAVILAERA
ncbi:MAG: tRNA 5-methoxyuridine(34)/uridine 5-oxyacetic acid(34) synthase CmoB [Pseudomonadota bacterium]